MQVSREEIAVLISGAPFPSKRSLAKADAILTLLGRETVQGLADYAANLPEKGEN